jgi:hypothetical protein
MYDRWKEKICLNHGCRKYRFYCMSTRALPPHMKCLQSYFEQPKRRPGKVDIADAVLLENTIERSPLFFGGGNTEL